MSRFFPLFMLLLVTAAAAAQDATAEPAGEASPEDPVHDELRALRDRMFQQYSERDVDGLVEGTTENVVITWQNGERELNRQEFLDFYNKMMKGDGRIVQDVTSDFKVDGLSILYGDDTAVAYGTCIDHFQLTSGQNFTLTSKWTATVVKVDDAWKVASFHISSNIFDNPIMNATKSWIMYAGIGGAVAGLLLGFVIASFLRRRPSSTAS